MKNIIISLLILFLFTSLSAKEKNNAVFLAQKIDGPTEHWYGPFSEGSAVFDVNNDGILDITSGPNRYEGPDFIKKPLRKVTTHGEFTNNGCEYPYDFNGDGWTDLVSLGWFDDYNIYWYENNKNGSALWKKHKIADSKRTEFLLFEDIDKDGDPDIIPCHMGQSEIVLIETDGLKFTQKTLGPHKVNQHGMGIGDVNGDGRDDIVSTMGWYMAPENPLTGEWIWFPEFDFGGHGSLPV
ncbi:VCBS repeat-containing protein, partial [bacterium]|nr:VCBS repeat-containing protein [bacterium]